MKTPNDLYWEPLPPNPSTLGDHEVPLWHPHLLGKRIALLVSGGIAAIKAPLLARELRKAGAEVHIMVSQEALRYTTLDALEWSSNQPVVSRLSARAEHLGDGLQFDAYLVAPATYNTLNKFRQGIADGLLTTTLAAALGQLEREQTQILLAPTLNGQMHNSIFAESIRDLQERGVTIIPPRDANGKHNLPEPADIVRTLIRCLSHSPLRQVPILVTGGPTPVPVDSIRRLTTHFSGQLGMLLAEELWLRGAAVFLVHGHGSLTPPPHLPHRVIQSYADYRESVHQILAERGCRYGVFSAAVADYEPQSVYPGKIPSGGDWSTIQLQATAKVIQEVRQAFPELHMVTFKFEQNLTHEALMAIAQQRLSEGYQAVVANRAEEMQDEHRAWLVTPQETQLLESKMGIALGLVNYLEKVEATNQVQR